MDTKSKNTKSQVKLYSVYLLIAIFSAVAFLSLLDVKDGIRNVFPSYVYSESGVAAEIESFTSKALDYSIYFKNDKYVNDKNNITDNEINSYKQQIEEKIEAEYQDFRSIKESSQSFYELDYDKQEEILSEERKKIEEKYIIKEEKIVADILESKKSQYKSRVVELNAYKNIKFAAYDKVNNIWIGTKDFKEDTIKKDSKFYIKRSVNEGVTNTEGVFINGKKTNNRNILGRVGSLSNNGYYMPDYLEEEQVGKTQFDNYDIDLYVWIPKNVVAGDSVYSSYEYIKDGINVLYIKIAVFFLVLAILVALVFILRKINRENILSEKVDVLIEKIKKWPIEYKVGILLIIYVLGISDIRVNYYAGYNAPYFNNLSVGSIISLTFILVAAYFIIKALIINYKEGDLLKNNITSKVIDTIKVMMSRGSIIKNIFLSITIYGVIGFTLLAIAAMSGGVLFPICFAVGVIMTIALVVLGVKKLLYLDKIMMGAKLGAEGRLSGDIEEKGTGLFRELAHDINNIKEGLRESIKKEMKSERLKSELITNVSHDLKTPLTSIINYIDLLKREELQPETARDYVRILDVKSQRLKTLIEDLFEASKAASGEMKLNIERLDVAQLLKQTLGEYDEKLNECSLEVKVNIPDEKIYINGDGKRLFRVFENLISNITKYSLKNTRVYIDVINKSDEVSIIMKNISSYELNFDAEEITSRFKRGDEARSTEGSGLGLAIAKSIIELHNGEFSIEVDGDLFKSIINLNR